MNIGRPSGEAKRMEDSMKLAIPDCRARILNTSRGLDKFRGAFRGWRLRRANRDRKYLKQGILLQGVARRFLQVKSSRSLLLWTDLKVDKKVVTDTCLLDLLPENIAGENESAAR